MPIIVDGYNLLFRYFDLATRTVGSDLRKLRERLVRALAQYGQSSGEKITVVFDGAAPGYLPRTGASPGSVKVVFSRHDQSADERIMDLLESMSGRRHCRVVSSDLEVQRFAKRMKAEVVPCPAFVAEMARARRDDSTPEPAEPLIKFQKPSEHEVDYWMRVFGEDSGR